MNKHCHLCGKPYDVTPERKVCDECYEANSSTRLFHGEDLLELIRRFKVGAWYSIPAAAEMIESISDVQVSGLYISAFGESKGAIEFKVKADVRFKE